MQLTKSVKPESLTLIAIISVLCSPNLRGRKPVVGSRARRHHQYHPPGSPKAAVPPTPSPPPKERGPRCQAQSQRRRDLMRQAKVPPLLGEIWGEGRGNCLFGTAGRMILVMPTRTRPNYRLAS